MKGAGRAAGSAGKGATGSVEAQDQTGEDGGHIALEQRGHAVKAKLPHPKFVLPTRDPKTGFEAILLSDQELVVGRLKVEFGEELGAPTLVDELFDMLLAKLAARKTCGSAG